MGVRTTIQIDEELLGRVRRWVPRRGLNRFVNDALREKTEELERRELERAMIEGYQATRNDRAALADVWRAVDAEGWPE
jgi:Arc/MetJ family transcription regulator